MTATQARYILQFGHIKLSETVIDSWIILIIIAILCFLLTRNFKKVPTSKRQIFVEFVVTKFDDFVHETMGEKALKILPGIVPYLLGLFLFFFISNIVTLIGMRSPTTDLDTTLAWASITLFLIYFTAFRSQGLAYFKTYIRPNPVFLPIHVIGEIARPISLSFRPFGNILGGAIIMELLYQFLRYISFMIPGVKFPFISLVIPVPLHFFFDLFEGVLQAFIFLMLTMVFVRTEAEGEE